MTHQSSRALARTWSYPRQRTFQKTMRQTATSWFASRGYPVDEKHPFILARWEDWPRNIILPEVVEYIQTVKATRDAAGQGFALHKYIHHGLSSQAMLFNLVGPLIVRGDFPLLAKIFGSQESDWPAGLLNAALEFENRAVFYEDSGQPTSIDLALLAGDTPFLFIECKFTEAEFGGCSVFAAGDCDGGNPAKDFKRCYLHHVGRRYWDLMAKHGFLDGPLATDHTCIMAAHYQFFRIVLFALEYGRDCVILSDERSPTFYCDGPHGERGLLPLLLPLLPEHVRSRVRAVTVQDALSIIKASRRHDWVSAFEEKYGL